MEWEQCKENIKPKREGRNISTITTTPKGTPLIAKIQEQQAKFEQEIKEYSGDDELEVWMRYVNYMEDAYPEGDYLSSVGVLQFRLIKRFQDEERYKQDSRLLKIFLSLAHRSTHATEVFSYCYHHQIVTRFSTFWLQWLNSYIYLQKYDRALKICEQAILIFDLSLFKDMKVQIVRLMDSSNTDNDNLMDVRKIGDQLFIDNSQNQRVGPSSQQNSACTRFPIFKDKNSCPPSLPSISTNVLETKQRNKENPQPKRQRWKNVVAETESAPLPAKTFSVFEEAFTDHTPKEEHKYEKCSSALKTKKVILTTEPTSNSKFPVLKASSNVTSTVAYHKSKVYPMNGEEWSFEEIEQMKRFNARNKDNSLNSSSSSKRSRDVSSSSNEDENDIKKICCDSEIKDQSLSSITKPLKSCLSETSKFSNITEFEIENSLMSSTKKIAADSVMAPNFSDAQKNKELSQVSLNLSVRSEATLSGCEFKNSIEDSLSVANKNRKPQLKNTITQHTNSTEFLDSSKSSDTVDSEVSGDFTLKGLQKSIGLTDNENRFEIFSDNIPETYKEIDKPDVIKGAFSKKKLMLKSPEKTNITETEQDSRTTFEIFSDDGNKTPVKEKSCLFEDSFHVAGVDGRPSDAFNIFKKTPEKSVEESYSLKKVAMTPSYNADNSSGYVPCTVEKMTCHPRGADTQQINKEALNILNECSKITETEESELEDNSQKQVSFANKVQFEIANNSPPKVSTSSKFEIFSDKSSNCSEAVKDIETSKSNLDLSKNILVPFCNEVLDENKQQLTPILEGSRESFGSSPESFPTSEATTTSPTDENENTCKHPCSNNNSLFKKVCLSILYNFLALLDNNFIFL